MREGDPSAGRRLLALEGREHCPGMWMRPLKRPDRQGGGQSTGGAGLRLWGAVL